MKNEQCCVVSCDRPLDKDYWDTQYKEKTIGWDLGIVSPPIKKYIDTLTDKNIAILIPGCGNTYEASYLLERGFTNITVIDIAPTLVKIIEKKFSATNEIQIILGDFFEHQGKYDLIIEQTFFCALPPSMRQKYVFKMHELLATNGRLSGLLFDRTFEVGPPFGGNLKEYELLFKNAFTFLTLEKSNNSIAPRSNSELFFEFEKNTDCTVSLYNFKGITCSGCMDQVSAKFAELHGVYNVSMNIDFTEVLIVSHSEIPLEKLQELVSYDSKYHINKVVY
jgi:SAM-dependent methyltransferase